MLAGGHQVLHLSWPHRPGSSVCVCLGGVDSEGGQQRPVPRAGAKRRGGRMEGRLSQRLTVTVEVDPASWAMWHCLSMTTDCQVPGIGQR